MSGQQRSERHHDDPDAPEPISPPTAAQARDTEVDALLEEIDGVLESNAESFVRGFIQKGGQ